jgi:DNA repair protein RadC
VNYLNEITVLYERKSIELERNKIKCSQDVIGLLKEVYEKNKISYQEEVIVLYLKSSDKLIGYQKLCSGGLTSAVIDVRLIFSTALKTLATGIIISHNHPSGNINPSKTDELITKKIVEAGKLLDINVLDHIIVNPDFEYFSFADEGYL